MSENISFDGKVLIVKNYLNITEINELKAWAILAEESEFVDGVSRSPEGESIRTKNRMTNRMSKNINYPPLVYQIQDRIRNDFKLENERVIEGHGKDGVVVSITHENGDVHKHRDPNMDMHKSCLRLNILASKPDNGGLIHVDENIYNPEAGDLMAYLVSDYEHSVETCMGQNPRIQFMFGFVINKNEWESGIYFNNYKEKS